MPYPPISWKAHADHQQSLFPTSVPWLVYQYFSKFRIKCNMEWLNLARWAWRYKPQCHLALLRQNGVYPLCCLSSMHIIDKKSIAWLTKHVGFFHLFLCQETIISSLHHAFSWNLTTTLGSYCLFSLSGTLCPLPLKINKGLKQGSPSANVVNCTVHRVLSWPSLVVRVHTDFYPFSA